MLHFRSFACAALLLLIPAPAALAHARLVRSVPEKGAVLSKAPGQIKLWFNELLDAGFNSIEIFAAAELGQPKRRNLAGGKPTVDTRDRTHLTLDLEPLPPGEYAVEWRVLSRDAHSAPGRFTFRILPPK
jgi:copper resistance protein C